MLDFKIFDDFTIESICDNHLKYLTFFSFSMYFLEFLKNKSLLI